ncbi:hypothetical protein CLNEO_07400 [Anaerotignum neopropionicum]|uniref:Uncharacterized protein n=1 Tax=Anaerotignum neopropionicum TaxID=36847 RepID=A0A136WG77_9FIRM|nr:hypothetical protein [Anaerotignum neopropionicum]KXL53514.1 hypothetical protein CLNEO_07400 [Anaerotignum neopropionicum]
MMWLIENWFILVVGIAAIVIGVSVAYDFSKLPTQKQVEMIKEWLLYACIQAEKELGSGTGQLKLRYVWDLFIARFPYFTKAVSFELFSGWVDAALIEMRMLLTQNKAIQEVVKGEAV